MIFDLDRIDQDHRFLQILSNSEKSSAKINFPESVLEHLFQTVEYQIVRSGNIVAVGSTECD